MYLCVSIWPDGSLLQIILDGQSIFVFTTPFSFFLEDLRPSSDLLLCGLSWPSLWQL